MFPKFLEVEKNRCPFLMIRGRPWLGRPTKCRQDCKLRVGAECTFVADSRAREQIAVSLQAIARALTGANLQVPLDPNWRITAGPFTRDGAKVKEDA